MIDVLLSIDYNCSIRYLADPDWPIIFGRSRLFCSTTMIGNIIFNHDYSIPRQWSTYTIFTLAMLSHFSDILSYIYTFYY